jgi:hypothetical protein
MSEALVLMFINWIGDNAISLLWMIVVTWTAFAIYGSAVSIATGLVTAIAAGSKPSEDELKRQAAEKLKSDERQQQYWKERHKHENPQCEVCKEEEEREKRDRESSFTIKLDR